MAVKSFIVQAHGVNTSSKEDHLFGICRSKILDSAFTIKYQLTYNIKGGVT
jgi:hypothetical protein